MSQVSFNVLFITYVFFLNLSTRCKKKYKQKRCSSIRRYLFYLIIKSLFFFCLIFTIIADSKKTFSLKTFMFLEFSSIFSPFPFCHTKIINFGKCLMNVHQITFTWNSIMKLQVKKDFTAEIFLYFLTLVSKGNSFHEKQTNWKVSGCSHWISVCFIWKKKWGVPALRFTKIWYTRKTVHSFSCQMPCK